MGKSGRLREKNAGFSPIFCRIEKMRKNKEEISLISYGNLDIIKAYEKNLYLFQTVYLANRFGPAF